MTKNDNDETMSVEEILKLSLLRTVNTLKIRDDLYGLSGSKDGPSRDTVETIEAFLGQLILIPAFMLYKKETEKEVYGHIASDPDVQTNILELISQTAYYLHYYGYGEEEMTRAALSGVLFGKGPDGFDRMASVVDRRTVTEIENDLGFKILNKTIDGYTVDYWYAIVCLMRLHINALIDVLEHIKQ